MSAPLASVGIPSFNHARWLPAAIESVLGQTLPDVELVIADDGSTDGSLEIARRYAVEHPGRVTVLTHPGHANRGIGPTASLYRNRLRGRYILGLASDDVLYPDALEHGVDFLERHPEVGYVYGCAVLIDEEGRRVPSARRLGTDVNRSGHPVERIVQGNVIPGMAMVIRRECLARAGDEHPTLVYSDWEFFARAAAHWDVGFIPRPLAGYRVHTTNTSINVSRETNLERALAVTRVLREEAPEVGGRLAEPRVRAMLELQMGFLLYADGDETAARGHLLAALDRDPSLSGDPRRLGDWLWARLLDRLLPDDGRDFVGWVTDTLGPRLDARSAGGLQRAAAATRHEARAIRLAHARRPLRAHGAALAAAARSPRRLADRQFASILLESVGGGRAGDWLRRMRTSTLRSP
ncbi:MAG: glycosyltransferase [Thermoleophilaceae bacterium]